MSTAHVAELCCRCGLSGEVMTDPVIVTTQNDPRLTFGTSYERNDLVKYIETEGKDKGQTSFVQNTILKRLLDDYWRHCNHA
jgi:hypothetical protein